MVLETVRLQKKFGKFTALEDVTLSVGTGEVFGFIGPNGAGKTTAIRILLGILRASGGTASLFGLDAWKDAVEIHKRLAYVPGDVNLWPGLTGGEVIDWMVNLRGAPADKARRQKLIERFDLDPSKKCRVYSKGNRQKVALIAAFCSDAELFILDEPTSGLDPLMEQEFVSCVLEQKANGKCVLLSSHILSEVEKLCDRVGIIRAGKIVETGALKDLRHLMRLQIYVETEKPFEPANMPGVHDVALKDRGVTFSVDSAALKTVMPEISKLGILKLESAPPTLEDLFMRHYDTAVSKTD